MAWTLPSEHEALLLLVNGVLLVAVLELAWLLLRRGGGHRRSVLANGLAGLGLMLALRLALGGAGLPWVALCLALAGVAHVLDLQSRSRNAQPPP